MTLSLPRSLSERSVVAGDYLPGGYHKRAPEAYDKSLCLIPKDVLDFILITQPKEWEKLKRNAPNETEAHFLNRLSDEIRKYGTLHVLRKGIKSLGCKFDLAYFEPVTGLNPEIQRLYQGNIFSIVRQLKYSEKNENSLDTVLFLNGLPIFTVELKNPLTGQTVQNAIRQYRQDRDPREPLFAFRRCLAHFAVDPDLVYFTTKLKGAGTRFIPFLIVAAETGPAMPIPGMASPPPISGNKSGRAIAFSTWSNTSSMNMTMKMRMARRRGKKS